MATQQDVHWVRDIHKLKLYRETFYPESFETTSFPHLPEKIKNEKNHM
jgi:hypothetical protein